MLAFEVEYLSGVARRIFAKYVQRDGCRNANTPTLANGEMLVAIVTTEFAPRLVHD